LRAKTLKPGDIYKITLNSTARDRYMKKLPVIVLNAGHKKYIKLAIVAPVTDWKDHLEENPFFVSLDSENTMGIKKKSMVDCFQIRAVSHSRFTEKVGTLPDDKMKQIKKSVSLILDIEPEDCE
jgi:mRNA interferase MazF